MYYILFDAGTDVRHTEVKYCIEVINLSFVNTYPYISVKYLNAFIILKLNSLNVS